MASLTPLPFHLVNVFTSTPHAGSQAAVILIPKGDPRGTDEDHRLLIPMDNTDKDIKDADGQDVPVYQIRWYTARGELPLCGHGTLAGAWVVFDQLNSTATRIAFIHPQKGQLDAVLQGGQRGKGLSATISLPIPSTTVVSDGERVAVAAPFADSMGIRAEDDVLQVATYDYGGRSTIVQIVPGCNGDLASMSVDVKQFARLSVMTIVTQLVGLAEDGAVQVRSRVFLPAMGLDEDTATGSAHAALTSYYLTGPGRRFTTAVLAGKPSWSAKFPSSEVDADPAATEKVEGATLECRQLSPRGGGMRCQVRDGRAMLTSQAWQVGNGTLAVIPEDASGSKQRRGRE